MSTGVSRTVYSGVSVDWERMDEIEAERSLSITSVEGVDVEGKHMWRMWTW